jgi:hypothetical protein
MEFMIDRNTDLRPRLCTAVDQRTFQQCSAHAVRCSLTQLRLAIECCYTQDQSACIDVQYSKMRHVDLSISRPVLVTSGASRVIAINNSRDPSSERVLVASIHEPALVMNGGVACTIEALKYRCYKLDEKAWKDLEHLRLLMASLAYATMVMIGQSTSCLRAWERWRCM